MSTKTIERFSIGDEIPLDAVFIHFDTFNDAPLIYEVISIPEKKESLKDEAAKDIIKAVVEYLNLKTGSAYTPRSKATVNGIRARINEGRTLDDFKKVIDQKTMEWLEDPKFSQFLRPSTLFGTKFDGYLSQAKRGDNADPFKELDQIMEKK